MSKPQKIVSFAGGYVMPFQESNLKLSEGIYSISSRCNLPYVELLGSGGFQKTISWGEYAEVPCNEMVTVKNASHHPGNIFINAGIDPYPMPSRITVPTPIYSTDPEFGTAGTRYQLDVRRAKRAYLYFEGTGPFTARVIGRSLTTHDTPSDVTTTVGSGYEQTHLVNALVQSPPIPLGYKAPMGDDGRPMALLDVAFVTFPVPMLPSTEFPAYFVAEYY